MDRALEELSFAKRYGAAGVHLRGIEHGMYLSDPYFWPLFARAEELDLAIVVHLGTATRREQIPFGQLLPQPAAFMRHIHNLMAGFHAVIASDYDRRFPHVRWGFLEGGATWALAVLQHHARYLGSLDEFLVGRRPLDPDALAAKNVVIACEADEDVAYLARLLGEEVLCVGTDYAHNDAGAELGAHRRIMERTDLDSTMARKIVDDNGRRLLGVSPAFTPAPALGAPEIPHVHGHDGQPAVLGPP
jgi:predicted TIM-barrel fold metal-dependent hydrolase